MRDAAVESDPTAVLYQEKQREQRGEHSLSIAFEEREDLRGPFGWFLEGRPVAAIVEQDEARVGDVVEDRDRDLEWHHPVVAAMDQKDRRLDAGEVGGVVVRQAHRLPAGLDELG